MRAFVTQIYVELLAAIGKNSAWPAILDVNSPMKRHIGIILFQIIFVGLLVVKKIDFNWFPCGRDGQPMDKVGLQLR